MKIFARALGAGLLATAMAGCAAPADSPFDAQGRYLTTLAQPEALLSTDRAFAQAAQERGQFTAYREYAAPEAVIFVPAAVNAQEWLAGRADPAEALRWQPHRVWSSCDGTLAVTQGGWQGAGGRSGEYLTVWRRQENGGYKWVLTQADIVANPRPAPAAPESLVADCATGAETPSLVTQAANAAARDSQMKGGGQAYDNSSRDNTLYLNIVSRADASRDWAVYAARGGTLTEVLRGAVPPAR